MKKITKKGLGIISKEGICDDQEVEAGQGFPSVSESWAGTEGGTTGRH